MPPFSQETVTETKMSMSLKLNVNNSRSNDSNDCHDVPYKPLILELPSASSFSTLATASTASTSSSYASSSASSEASKQKMKRTVSFREDADVVTLEPLDHDPRQIHDRWYSKRELCIIRHKIRSLLRWYNQRNAHFFQYEQQSQVEYYDDESQESYLQNVPPPPAPPCVTFYEESLFGLEKHLFAEKEQVRETKYHSQSVVFSEQQLQKQMGQVDENRLAYEYAQTSAASQHEALAIAQINALESELYGQELRAQQQFEEEQRKKLQQLQEQRELEIRTMESLETSLLSQSDSDLEHLYLGEGRPPRNPLDVFKNWGACFGKLFRPQECKIDADDDCWNAPSRQRHSCLNAQEEQDYYYH